MMTTHAVPVLARSPLECAAELNAPAAEIDLMTMPERRRFLQELRRGRAAELGAGDRWLNHEGVIEHFAAHRMGAPGSWVSLVNAGVLEAIERGIALALDPSADDYGNPGARAWAEYLTRLNRGELVEARVHSAAWSKAKEVATDAGVALAQDTHGLRPTVAEQHFLDFARIYNRGMRNRALIDVALKFGGLLDKRLGNVTPELIDWFMNVGDPDAARAGCEIAHTIATALPAGASLAGDGASVVSRQVLDLCLAHLDELRAVFDNRDR